MSHCFVGLPRNAKGKTQKTYLYKADRKKKVRQVLWGDWLNIDGEEADGWLRVNWAPNGPKPETLFIPKAHTNETRPLEMVFLDVGQGDGAVLITPERDDSEAVIVIDAGISEHMHDFLSKRFKPYNDDFRFHAAIITHPDEDHYGGFESIFSTPGFGFDVVYHNGSGGTSRVRYVRQTRWDAQGCGNRGQLHHRPGNRQGRDRAALRRRCRFG